MLSGSVTIQKVEEVPFGIWMIVSRPVPVDTVICLWVGSLK
jgi:hypothetical protein